jgi:diaminohydroxyphosphoribosylaminopyrimidine deaminase/5-amino-6-(5-phosphoribosylamino)uracil reductase
MKRALGLARRGRGRVEPNPMVGAVIVRDGSVVGEGYYHRFGGPHAEVHALKAAGESARDATLYVTLEPCDHEGKTPACAPLVAASGVSRVVVATPDPTCTTPDGGIGLLRRQGIAVDVGACAEAACELNAGFFKLAATGRPLVTAKWAMSLDGKIATHVGSSKWITSEGARARAHALRGRVDCIIVGGRTVEADDPFLTCRSARPRRVAARLVVCGRHAPSPACRLARTAREVPVVLAYPAAAPPEGLAALERLGCELLPLPGDGGPATRVSVDALLAALGARRMTNVLVEGGGGILGSFFDAAAVDRVTAFVAPLIIGGAGATAAVAGRGVAQVADAHALSMLKVRRTGADLVVEGRLSDPMQWLPRSD